jgi:uncharacterized membrane protein YeaQ/YmgE (transglycosylase-associated protein family)
VERRAGAEGQTCGTRQGKCGTRRVVLILFGLIVGFLARAIMPGKKQKMGLIATALLGVVGSFLGGFGSNRIYHRPVLELHSAGFIGSVLGALVLLFIVYAGQRRSAFAS